MLTIIPSQRDKSLPIFSQNKKVVTTTMLGFTLIELLLVIAIISLLSTVVLASLNSAREKARDAVRRSDLQQIARANELYYHEEGNGSYIPLTGFLGNTVQYGGGSTAFNAVIPKYLSRLPNDPLYPQPGISGGRAYSYLIKSWAGCANGTTGFTPDPERFAIYARLENPTADDLATMSDAFDACNASGWGFNYRVGN